MCENSYGLASGKAAVKAELFKLVTVPSDAWKRPALNTSSLHEWYRSGHQWLSNDAPWPQSMLKQVYTVCWLKMYHLKRGNLFLTNKMGLKGPQWCLWNPKWVLNWTREHKIDPTWRPRNPKWSPANPKTSQNESNMEPATLFFFASKMAWLLDAKTSTFKLPKCNGEVCHWNLKRGPKCICRTQYGFRYIQILAQQPKMEPWKP